MIQAGSIDMKAMSISGEFIIKGAKFRAEEEFSKLNGSEYLVKFIKSFDTEVSVGTLKLLSMVSKDVLYKVYDGSKLVIETHDFTKVILPKNEDSQVIVFGEEREEIYAVKVGINKGDISGLAENLEKSSSDYYEVNPNGNFHTVFMFNDGSIIEKYGQQNYDFNKLSNDVDSLVGFYLEASDSSFVA